MSHKTQQHKGNESRRCCSKQFLPSMNIHGVVFVIICPWRVWQSSASDFVPSHKTGGSQRAAVTVWRLILPRIKIKRENGTNIIIILVPRIILSTKI